METNIVNELDKKIHNGEIPCTHRHYWPDHKSCFAQGRIKGIEKIDYLDEKSFIKATGLPWYVYEKNKIGFLDIESDGLKADFSTMLTWCIKEKDGVIYHDEITKEELFEGKSDERIVKSCIETMKKFRIICGYYSTNFDIPWLRAKALHFNVPFPSYGDLYHFDLYYLVKSKLCISRKSLDSACDYLGIKGKTPIDKDVWRKAKYGDPKSIKLVLAHNMGDVKITEALYKRLIDSSKWTRRSI
jgi:uncharacterized protein YprB with RNaseH-like and TPR domain